MKKSTKICFGVFVLVSILLIITGNTKGGTRIQLHISSIFSPIEKWVSFVSNEMRLRRENRILKLKVAKLALENQTFKSLQYENRRLRKLLKFKTQQPHKLIVARIIGRAPNPISGTCLIDKGRRDGIKENMPVITPEGVYGKIVETTEKRALLETIFNFNFRLPIMNLRTGGLGIAKWDASKGGVIAQIAVTSDVKIGDEIVTSEIGDIFPDGLKVGTVKRISMDETRLFHNAVLEPACNFLETKEIFVITEPGKIEEEEPVFKTRTWEVSRKKKEKSPPMEFEIPEPVIRLPE